MGTDKPKTRGDVMTAGLLADQAGIVIGPLLSERTLLAQGFRPGKLTWGGPSVPIGAQFNAHVEAEQRTIVRPRRGDRRHNQPVPRQASGHYYNEELTRSVSSTYFY